MTITLNY